MKWIGQHIWNLISRFRSDVYLDNIEDGTVANDKFLGLDANNKIVKEAASTTVTDLHSAGVDGSANQILTDDGDGTITSESNLTFNNEGLVIGVGDSGDASFGRKTNPSGGGGGLQLYGGAPTGSNLTGGDLKVGGGVPTGSAAWGDVLFLGGITGGSGAGSNIGSITTIAKINCDSTTTNNFYLYEPGTPGGDNFKISTAIHGATTLSTTDVAAAAADLTLDPDGKVVITPADLTGDVFHLDANADTDNVVNIDAGILDIDTNSGTIDVVQSLNITGSVKLQNRTLSITAGSAAGEFDGDVVYTGTTTGMTTGNLYVYANTGQWVLANAAAVGTTKGLLAIALGDESDVDGMLLRGMVTTNGVAGTQDEGAELYIRATNGAITTVAPNSTGQFVRIVGYCMENSNSRIYFNPDNTYIEIA